MAVQQTLADLLPLRPGVTRPNAYEVFGLEPLESDPQRIGEAVKTVTRRLKAAESESDPQIWKAAARAVMKARKILLDAEAKAAYDARLRPRAASGAAQRPAGVEAPHAGASVAAAPSAPPADPLADLLPPGDPSAPFDMAAYLETHPDVESSEDAQPPGEGDAAGAPALDFSWAADAEESSSPAPSSQGASGLGAEIAAVPVTVRPPTRRRRSRLPVSGILMSVVVIGLFAGVGFCLWLLLGGRPGSAPHARGAAGANARPADVEPAPAAAEPDPVMGNLPATRPVPRRAAGGSRFPMPEGFPMPAGGDQDEPQESGEGPLSPAAADGPPEGAPADPEPEMTEPEMSAPDSSGPAFEEVTAAEAGIAAAREAIRTRQWDTMLPLAEQAAAGAVTPEQREIASALHRLAAYAVAYRDAIIAAVDGMEAGEAVELRPGMPVVLVEASPEQVVVRAAGQNKTYAMGELPLVLAHALAPLKLAPNAPATIAYKAAFQAISPLATPEHRQQAFRWWEEAAAGGEIDTGGLREAVEKLFP